MGVDNLCMGNSLFRGAFSYQQCALHRTYRFWNKRVFPVHGGAFPDMALYALYHVTSGSTFDFGCFCKMAAKKGEQAERCLIAAKERKCAAIYWPGFLSPAFQAWLVPHVVYRNALPVTHFGK